MLVRAYFGADARCGKAHSRFARKLLFPRDITARGRNGSAGIFYKRSHYKIRSDVRRFARFHELSVAVVYDDGSGRKSAHKRYDIFKFVDRICFSAFVPRAALNVDQSIFSAIEPFLYVRLIECAVIRICTFKPYTEIGERAVPFPEDHGAQCVIRQTR